jgi:hypothetical protein
MPKTSERSTVGMPKDRDHQITVMEEEIST